MYNNLPMESSTFPHCVVVSPLLLLLAILVLFSLPQSTAQTSMNMTRGGSEILSPSGTKSLLSPSGDFAFGFRAYDSNASLFLLAIWFNAASPQHIIWFAMNQGNLILANVNSTLRLNQDGLLTLTGSDGTQIWSSIQYGADHAALLDSGNFVICTPFCDRNYLPLWESFQYPTDTIVPGQNLSKKHTLWSKLTDSNFSQGRFTLIVQENNDLVLYPVSLPTRDNYHALWLANTNQNCNELVFNSNGSLYCQRDAYQVDVIPFTVHSTLDFYQHATIDPDGSFRIYAYAKKNGAVGWQVIGQNYPDSCLAWKQSNSFGGGGICGENGYCYLQELNQTRVKCECPPNYSNVDPDNIYAGCKSDLDLQLCGSIHEASEFELKELPNADWQSEDYEWYRTFSEAQCKDNCLQDCSCAVAIYISNGDQQGCHKKSVPLQLGIRGTGVNGNAFFKVPKSNSAKNSATNRFHFGNIIFLLAAGVLLLMVALLVAHLKYTLTKAPMDLNIPSWSNLREFTYKELEDATKNFQEMLGRGNFGVVYKGFIMPSDPSTAIAVKILDPLNDGEREFESEVHSIGRTHHKNLVKLIGFCNEGSNIMLVYDYMSKGSLENYMKYNGEHLAWDKRAEVALGVAKGLQYLHEDCDPPVIHCDIKPQNILLDDKYVAKISDFGVAKLLGADQTHTSTYGRGTFGYIAPEWIQGEQVTPKVDVYSFGVLLVNIIFCMENIGQQASRYVRTGTTSQAVKQLVELLVQSIDDDEDKPNIQSMQKFVEVAVNCLQADPNVRPTMRDVAYLLAHAMPKPPLSDKIPVPIEADTIHAPQEADSTPALGDDVLPAQTPEIELPLSS